MCKVGLLPLGLGLDEAIAQSTANSSLRLIFKPYAIRIKLDSIPYHYDQELTWTAFSSARMTVGELIECAVHDLGLPTKVKAGGQPIDVQYQLRATLHGEGKHLRG